MNTWYRRPENTAKVRGWARRTRARRVSFYRLYDKNRLRIPKPPEKVFARNTLNHAIEHGKVTRQSCTQCGQQDAQAHHPDYAQPLQVVWLCWTHHMQIHRYINPYLD